MSACRYCGTEVAWVPTMEGHRPFVPTSSLSPDAPVAVLKAHECAERKRALEQASREFARSLYQDPMIRSYALTLPCPEPRCAAEANVECIDLRSGQDRTTKHPHQGRLIEGVRLMQEHTGR